MGKIERGHSPFSKVHHVGIIVKDVEKTAEYYGTFGVGPFELLHIERRESLLRGKPLDDLNLRIKQARVGSIRVELIQPIGGEEYPWMKFLKTQGEGISHIAFVVDDVEKEEARLSNIGISIIFKTKYLNGGAVSYFDTDKIGGVIFELLQRPTGYVPSVKKETMTDKTPFKNLFQIGTVAKDLDKTIDYYESLGIGPWIEGPSATVINRRIYGKPSNPKVKGSIAMLGDIELEMMQPIEGESIQMEFLKSKGEGGIHINCKPDDWGVEKAKMIEKGFPIISSGEMPGTESGGFSYFDTRKYGGVIWELERK